VFLAFEPVRLSVQGDLIRDIDGSNMNNNSHGRKSALGDSDDEDQQSHLNANDRSTMDIYRQRQQKRVKLTTTNATDLATPPVLT
jgi:hypothetical protein